MNISHGNRNKRCFLTENGGWNQLEKKAVRFHFCSQYDKMSCSKTLRGTFSNFISRWFDYSLRTGFINRWERMDLLNWKHLLKRHNLNFRHVSKSAVLTVGDNIFKYWKTLPKQTQVLNPAFFISIQSVIRSDTISSHFANLLPLWIGYISMKILS